MAGINAGNYVLDKEPFTLGRDQAYIGVMIDDLTSLGVTEPYRMFTSRAEYRLHLREDNADARLTPAARALGLISEDHWKRFCEHQEFVEREKARLHSTHFRPTEETFKRLAPLNTAPIIDMTSLAELLRRPEISYERLVELEPAEYKLPTRLAARVETEIKLDGYLKRQERDIERFKRMENTRIPDYFNFTEVKGLSREVCERLSHNRPETLGQASRISGVTPAAISLLAIYLKKGEFQSERSVAVNER
jgi:tRNA uridine 5-carboxymethylaminomethyl modification enzyme